MIMIKRYGQRKDVTGRIQILSYEVQVCPVCGHSLIVIGTRERKYTESSGVKQTLIIRRLRCKDCRVIHHELPDILIPYKRHCADTVENVIAGDISDVCCDNRTITRIKAWWDACQQYLKNVIASLREKYDVEFPLYPAPREIVRAVANANLWIHTRSAFLSG